MRTLAFFGLILWGVIITEFRPANPGLWALICFLPLLVFATWMWWTANE